MCNLTSNQPTNRQTRNENNGLCKWIIFIHLFVCVQKYKNSLLSNKYHVITIIIILFHAQQSNNNSSISSSSSHHFISLEFSLFVILFLNFVLDYYYYYYYSSLFWFQARRWRKCGSCWRKNAWNYFPYLFKFVGWIWISTYIKRTTLDYRSSK